jgi:tRNA-specific 2-thiouridylase
MSDKVIVGLSGGVDSAVAAALLQQDGYDVVGVTISPFNLGEYYSKYEKDSGCTIKASVLDAQNICKALGIPHYTVDFSDTFKENVVDYFIQEYLDGRTPNPCVKCNPIIKWGELLKFADKLGAKYLATGHYARTRFDEELKRYVLMRGTDRTKDQSYFLWKLSQEQLSRTIFPLGNMNKENTRAIAKEFGLPVYNKPESQEVCFIADDDYHNFLTRTVDDIDSIVGEGDIVFEGKVIGRHKGYPFYTIGQRKGLGISYKEPLYVLGIDAEKKCNRSR